MTSARFRARALLALLLFVAWTGIVRLGIAEGSRHAVWTTQPFGWWPEHIDALDGSNNLELSIRAGFASGGMLGSSTTGTTTDYGDPANINGSRFVTGIEAGRVTSMSAYVAAPVDAAPHNQFELAIYEDNRGAPGRLLARSERGTLNADQWNTVPIDTVLAPRTPYWLLYNNNGSHETVNNLTFAPLTADPLDAVIRVPRSGRLRSVAYAVSVLGSPGAAALAALGIAAWVGRKRPVFALLVAAGLVASAGFEWALKEAVFAPYATYPSGHALRATFLAVAVVALAPRRVVRVAAWTLAVAVGLGAIHPNRHYSEEVIGGALAGWAFGSAALAVAFALEPGERRVWLHRRAHAETRRSAEVYRPPLRPVRLSPASEASLGRRCGYDRRLGERRRSAPVQVH